MTQLHIFIFVLAVLHVLFGILTIYLAREKVSAMGYIMIFSNMIQFKLCLKSYLLWYFHVLESFFGEILKSFSYPDEALESMGHGDRNIGLSVFTW
jgi:hypothetical protein